MSYSFNPFDLLDENGGDRVRKQAPKPAAPKPPKPVDAPKAQQTAPQQKAAPAKNAAATGAAPAGGKKENDGKARPQGDAQRPRGPGKEGVAVKRSPGQGPRPQQQGGAPAAPRSNDAAGGEGDKPRERRERDHRGHADRPHRGRQFDRRSGTGRPANENKKGGSGKGNWGGIEEGQETEVNKAVETADVEKEENAAPVEGEATEPAKEVEKEKELLSLDEYLATKKKQTIEGVEAPKLRAAGEGVDSSAWADYAPLEKGDGDDAPLKKKKDSKKAVTNGKDEKVSVDKLFRVTMPPHEGAGESRGRGRGGKPPGFNKGGSGRGRAPGQGQGQGQGRSFDRRPKQDSDVALADQTQFPSLGGSGGAAPAQSAPAPVKA